MKNISCPKCGNTGTLEKLISATGLSETLQCKTCGFESTKNTETGEFVTGARNIAMGASALLLLWKAVDSFFGKSKA